jgi:hypothetical protein
MGPPGAREGPTTPAGRLNTLEGSATDTVQRTAAREVLSKHGLGMIQQFRINRVDFGIFETMMFPCLEPTRQWEPR